MKAALARVMALPYWMVFLFGMPLVAFLILVHLYGKLDAAMRKDGV